MSKVLEVGCWSAVWVTGLRGLGEDECRVLLGGVSIIQVLLDCLNEL